MTPRSVDQHGTAAQSLIRPKQEAHRGCLKRIRAYVTGAVQGVGYRYPVTSLARKKALKGYVQILKDGRVEVVVEGDEGNVEAFLREIRIRDPPIDVEDIETIEETPTGEFQHFKIRTGTLAEEMLEGFETWAYYLRDWSEQWEAERSAIRTTLDGR